MQPKRLDRWRHHHDFVPAAAHASERRTWAVIGLTGVMMVVEVTAGTLFNSMALLADGWHMASHAAALGITAFAYAFARRHRDDPAYTFGTGKVGVLGGFTSAVVLAVIAFTMAYGSIERFLSPRPISFDEALVVAVVGLGTNLVSAWLLGGGGADHHHGHEGHDHHHDSGHHHDYNLRAAYLHVIADALTSVLAIIALLCGKHLGWDWLDPAMGIVGSVLILRWSWGLLRDTGRILLDACPGAGEVARIRELVESDGDARVVDLHLWRLSTAHRGVIVSVVAEDPMAADEYRARLDGVAGLAHVTIEVRRFPQSSSSSSSSS